MKNFFSNMLNLFNPKTDNSSEDILYSTDNNANDIDNTDNAFVDDAFIDGTQLSAVSTSVYLKK